MTCLDPASFSHWFGSSQNKWCFSLNFSNSLPISLHFFLNYFLFMYLFINKYLLTFLLKTRPIYCFPQKTSLPFTEHVVTWVSRERILCTSILFTQKLQTITICYLLSKAMIQNVWVARIWGLQKHSGKIKKCLILLFLPRHSLLATAGEVILGYTFDLPFVFSVRLLNFSFPPPQKIKSRSNHFLRSLLKNLQSL